MNNTTAEPWCPSCASIAKDIRLKVQNLATLYTCTDEWHDAEARRTDVSEIAHDPLVDESYTGKIARLESELAAAQERISTLLTGIQIIEQNKIKAAHAYADSVIAERKCADEAEQDAKRYRWLRDKSVPPHNFYISVPVEFHEVRYKPNEVDSYIDEAMKNG